MIAATAVALQRLVEALADVSVAITQAETPEEVFQLWQAFAPLINTGQALQDRMAMKIDQIQEQQ